MSVFFIRRGDAPEAFAVSSSLTHCSSSNPATSVRAGKPYTATLTMDSGFSTLSVTVTMGGVDITSSAYSNGTISIAAVTGDIVVTAVASAGIPVTITGNGRHNIAHVTIDGVEYTAPSTVIANGAIIGLSVYGVFMAHGTVYVNGASVLDVNNNQTKTYNLSLAGLHAVSIDLYRSGTSYGTIRVTTT